MGEPGPTAEERNLDRLLLLWKEHESIAMHFNDLIARFRVQALGGTATIGAVAALITSKTAMNQWTFVAVLAFLFVAWTALWALDYGYYNKLLGGAVKALLELEGKLPHHVRLSTSIEGTFRSVFQGHLWFYGLIQVALFGLFYASLYDAVDETGIVFVAGVGVFAVWTIAAVAFAAKAPIRKWWSEREEGAKRKTLAEGARDMAQKAGGAKKTAKT